MRTSTTAFLIFVLATAIISVQAQSQKVLESAIPNYYNALKSSNEGTIESAIENLVKLKIFAPDLDYSQVAEQLEYLTEHGTTKDIKSKAFVAYLYLENPAKFNWISKEDKAKKVRMIDAMFTRLGNR